MIFFDFEKVEKISGFLGNFGEFFEKNAVHKTPDLKIFEYSFLKMQ